MMKNLQFSQYSVISKCINVNGAVLEPVATYLPEKPRYSMQLAILIKIVAIEGPITNKEARARNKSSGNKNQTNDTCDYD